MTHLNIRQVTFASVLIVFFSLNPSGVAQMVGSRGGGFDGDDVYSNPQPASGFQELDAGLAQSVIMVEGKSVMSVEPSAIRIVLALTFEGLTSKECKTGMDERIEKLRSLWNQAGRPDNTIVEDFISVLPRYEIEIAELNDHDVAMEKKTGYIMQTNIHLAVKDDAEAMKVLDVAFTNGVSDIIGFDYWSDQLAQKKKEVREKAIQAAKEKAELLLGLFAARPPVINVQEETSVIYPESMYKSFENSFSNEYRANYSNRRNLPLISLPRPKNTYYRGNLDNADTQAKELPMRAKLSVVSTVRIYYESPTAKGFNAGGKE